MSIATHQMSQHEAGLVQKVWNLAHVLRDSGIYYSDYLSQITCLLFLKMDDERATQMGEPSAIPAGFGWQELKRKDGDELEIHYRNTLTRLATEKGLVGTIYAKSQSKFSNPADLKRVIGMIDEETWYGLPVDVKGAIYEGLLEKNANENKSGAGQYFTPRALIQAMVEVVNPKVGETICDPACGTGGFLLAAYEHMKSGATNRDNAKFLREKTFFGNDISGEVVRLCTMNLYLHGIGNGEPPVVEKDALASPPAVNHDIVLANPPFGKKSSIRILGEDNEVETQQHVYERDDFRYTTSNKQLNFLQHIFSQLKMNGRAAVVLPDNVLFEAGGAAEGIRRRLLQEFDFHTLLRLPTGIFYKQGVKANVLFFDKKPPRDSAKETNTQELWIYDFRTNYHFTLVENPLKRSDLDDFVACYASGERHKRTETERFKRFPVADLIARDKVNLDIFWLKDDSLEDAENLPAPELIAADIVENLEAALEQFRAVAEELRGKANE